MRLWSIHPCYLDSKGLVALWREGLLAQSVLLGKTRGYKNHPQLSRFKGSTDPAGAIASYLRGVLSEAEVRGYKFDRRKILSGEVLRQIPVSNGQVGYEFQHLLRKLKTRDPVLFAGLEGEERVKVHPLFVLVDGGVAEWEKV